MNVIARGSLALAIVLPWLALVPWSSRVLVVLTASLAITAGFHGLGLLVGRLARRPVGTWLAVQWGIAASIALTGVAIMLRVGDRSSQLVLVFGGVAIHGAVLMYERTARVQRLIEHLRQPDRRYWLVPVGLAACFSFLYVLGAAGDLGGRPFDDDGHYLAQLKRLTDTGTLEDPLGFARSSQLGGQVGLAAVSLITSDVLLAGWIDNGLCFALMIALAVGRVRPRDESTALWATLGVIAASALPFSIGDASPSWSAAGLILALFLTLEDHVERPSTIPLALIIGALATLRNELVPIAIAGLVGAWWIGRRPWRADLTRIAILAGVASIVVLPYLVTRMLAWSVAPDAYAVLVPARSNMFVQLGLFVIVLAIAIAVLSRLTDHMLRWPAIAVGAGLAGIATQLSGARPHATQFVWPIAIAIGLLIVIELARRPQLRAVGVSVLLALSLVIYAARDASGRKRWTRRLTALSLNIEYLRHGAAIAGGYTDLLAQVPRHQWVAVWVGHPELIDHAAHRILDLRTPHTARLRAGIERVLAHSGARYLLLEADARTDALASTHFVLASRDGVTLIDLSRSR